MTEIPLIPVTLTVAAAAVVIFGTGAALRQRKATDTSSPKKVWLTTKTAVGAGLFVVAVFGGISGVATAYGSVTGQWRNVSILSGSMEPALHRGDIAVVAPVNVDDVAVGDVLVFNAPMAAGIVRQGDPVIHRVIEIVDPEELRDTQPGSIYVRTKGDNNDNADRWIVELNEGIWRQSATVRDAGEAFLLVARPNARFGILLAVSILLGATAVSELLGSRRNDDYDEPIVHFVPEGGIPPRPDVNPLPHWIPRTDSTEPPAEGSPDGTGPDGTGPDGTGHDGTGPDGTGHDGTGHDGTGHDGTGHDGTGHDDTGSGPEPGGPANDDPARSLTTL